MQLLFAVAYCVVVYLTCVFPHYYHNIWLKTCVSQVACTFLATFPPHIPTLTHFYWETAQNSHCAGLLKLLTVKCLVHGPPQQSSGLFPGLDLVW